MSAPTTGTARWTYWMAFTRADGSVGAASMLLDHPITSPAEVEALQGGLSRSAGAPVVVTTWTLLQAGTQTGRGERADEEAAAARAEIVTGRAQVARLAARVQDLAHDVDLEAGNADRFRTALGEVHRARLAAQGALAGPQPPQARAVLDQLVARIERVTTAAFATTGNGQALHDTLATWHPNQSPYAADTQDGAL